LIYSSVKKYARIDFAFVIVFMTKQLYWKITQQKHGDETAQYIVAKIDGSK